MFKKIAIAIVVLIAAVLLFAATRPNTFRVQRSAAIKAPPEKIYGIISDFKRWGSWSPYEKFDPAMKRTYGDVTSGKGAVYAWEGNSQVGSGRMEITAVSPPSGITIALDFYKPFTAHNTAEYTLQALPDSTTFVTWAMHGPQPYLAKVMCLFVNMDKMVGGQFEEGLANLKAVSEKPE